VRVRAEWVTGAIRRALATPQVLLRSQPYVFSANAVAVLAIAWFVLAPADTQRPVLRTVTSFLAALTTAGLWQLGRDPRMPAAAARFWRLMALGMLTFTAGMLIDLGALVLREVFALPVGDIGQAVLYPVGGVLALRALMAFPTTAHRPIDKIKLALDVVIVLFGSATFVWYFVASRRWQPYDGWEQLSDGLVLPALTLVGGFVVLRITLAGVNIICRPTVVCFVVGSLAAAIGIVIGPGPDTTQGRVASVIHVIGLTVTVLGVQVQRWQEPGDLIRPPAAWRRSFGVLPYGAVAATMALLLLAVGGRLDYRGIVVVVGVLALCAAVMARQLASLWENSRLLSDNRELNRKLRHQAYHDELTGLANRTLFTGRVSQALDRTTQGGELAVLFVDLDDFKVVNDSLGHHAGDQLLRAVARRLTQALDERYTLGRLGGDEFAVLVEGEDATGAQRIAQHLVSALDAPFRINGMQVRVRASVGIAAGAAGAPTTAELLRNADIAMYAAKTTHNRLAKGGWQVFEPGMLAVLQGRHRLQAALVQAVERDEFVVFYQPIVDLADGTVRGAEALVRWRRPDGEVVEPGRFIALAEETGLVAEIDRRVLTLACAQVARWGTHGEAPGFGLHVNVSARQLHRAELVADVAGALAASGLPPRRLTLEITESGLGGDAEAAIERLVGLAGLGVHLAIDDFGTGYSSLAYLRRMPVDVLKIDKTFVDELATETDYVPLAQAVVALAGTLGMHTVAEGIEHPAQVSRLLALGCRYGQGFHFARPLPAADMGDLVRWLARRGAEAPAVRL